MLLKSRGYDRGHGRSIRGRHDIRLRAFHRGDLDHPDPIDTIGCLAGPTDLLEGNVEDECEGDPVRIDHPWRQSGSATGQPVGCFEHRGRGVQQRSDLTDPTHVARAPKRAGELLECRNEALGGIDPIQDRRQIDCPTARGLDGPDDLLVEAIEPISRCTGALR